MDKTLKTNSVSLSFSWKICDFYKYETLWNVQGSALRSICNTNIYNKPTPHMVSRVFSCCFDLQDVPTTKPGVKRVKSEWL